MAIEMLAYKKIHSMRGTKLYSLTPKRLRLFFAITLYKEKTMLVPEKNNDTPKAIQNPGSLIKSVSSSSVTNFRYMYHNAITAKQKPDIIKLGKK